jgi:hypothetical protein
MSDVKPVEISGKQEGISEKINELETNSKNKNFSRIIWRHKWI